MKSSQQGGQDRKPTLNEMKFELLPLGLIYALTYASSVQAQEDNYSESLLLKPLQDGKLGIAFSFKITTALSDAWGHSLSENVQCTLFYIFFT